MEVEILVDGEQIPINWYVKKVFFNVISSLLSTLKGVDEDWKRVEIKIMKI